MSERDLRAAAPRPDGVAGLLIDEIELQGIFRNPKGGGYVAQVSTRGVRRSYLLREGDQLYDGDVITIDRKEVVFKQVVANPTASKPFREVVMSLPDG